MPAAAEPAPELSVTNPWNWCTWSRCCSRSAQDNQNLQISEKTGNAPSHNVYFFHLANTNLQKEEGDRVVILAVITARITSSVTISTTSMGLAAQLVNCCTCPLNAMFPHSLCCSQRTRLLISSLCSYLFFAEYCKDTNGLFQTIKLLLLPKVCASYRDQILSRICNYFAFLKEVPRVQ